MASATGQRNGHSYSGSASHINQKAQLANAYQELGKELGSDKVKCVGGYTVGRVIGEGTYGSVHLATHRLTGTRCAIKKIPKSACSALTREIHHHRKLHHASILHLHEIIATESHIWLVTELCSGGELFDYLVERGRFLEGEARRVFGELCVAVGWMHARGTVHRDLKLENIFLDGELKVKLGDLGFAREWQRGNLMETFCGTTGYASPEMLAGRKYLGQETDVWSLGIILYTLLCGGLPFDHDDEETMKTLIAKGEYEEPEWLSEEARDLIRGMLKHEPSERLSMESILTHPWFKCTIYDNSTSQASTTAEPGPSVPPSPMLMPPSPSHTGYFSEPFQSNSGAVPSHLSLNGNSPFPSPLAQSYIGPPSTSAHTSETSDASFEFHDEDKGRLSSGVTTPTTAEGDDEADRGTPLPKSEDFKLNYTLTNESQSTIRRSGAESPRSTTGSILKGRVAIRGSLEDQTEEDEDVVEEMAKRNSVSFPETELEDHTLHLPLALHSRTPSRTKRRSVSSTMSLERRHSFQNTSSSQWVAVPPIDYLAQLNEPSKPFMTTPSEKQLLNQLSALGFDTGQLVHSVMSDACDASSAMWWILRIKQLERGETDEALAAAEAAAVRRKERRRKDSKESSGERDRNGRRRDSPPEHRGTDVFNATDASARTSGSLQLPADAKAPHSPAREMPELGAPVDRVTTVRPDDMRKASMVSTSSTVMATSPIIAMTPLQDAGHTDGGTGERLRPRTPPYQSHIRPTVAVSPASPAGSSPKKRPENKARSASVSMLQRATSAFGVHVGARKSEERVFADDDEEDTKDERERRARLSPSKLTKAPPLFKTNKEADSQASSRNGTAKSTPAVSPQQVKTDPMLSTGSLSSRPNLDSINSATSLADSNDTTGSRGKTGKRDSLLTTVRSWFNEDRRKRKRNVLPSPLAGGTINGTALIASRGIGSRQSHGYGVMSRRTSLDAARPGMHSRRSSSVNSRRSSLTEMHRPSHIELGLGNPPYEQGMLHRRQSDRSHRSGGSRTPTSEREFPSRPSSVHSYHRNSASRPNMHGRSPSLNSQNSAKKHAAAHAHTTSPLHNYHRRAPSGGSSTRVRHVRAIHESHLRSGSIPSSARSANSSRHSSFDRGDRPLEFGELDDDASIRSWKRRSREDRSGRNRSPLSSQAHTPKLGVKPKAPLRDVFNNSNKTDDDWESEDDEQSGFAGGVGQSSTKAWTNSRSSMSVHPASAARETHANKRGLLGASTYRERMGVGVPEEEAEEAGSKSDDGEAVRTRGRGQLPVRGGNAPFRSTVIEEEEEEEE